LTRLIWSLALMTLIKNLGRHSCVVTADLPTLGTNPNSKQHGSATQEAQDLGNLKCLGQTVRSALADGLQGAGGRSENETRTTSTAPRNTYGLYSTLGRSMSNSCRVDGSRAPGGRSTNTLQQNTARPKDRTMNAQEQATNWRNTWPRGLSTFIRWIVCQVRTEQLEPENEKSTPPIHPWISQTA
jgi:hypothetical protein